jgi:hypothetical protein
VEGLDISCCRFMLTEDRVHGVCQRVSLSFIFASK